MLKVEEIVPPLQTNNVETIVEVDPGTVYNNCPLASAPEEVVVSAVATIAPNLFGESVI
jgi:hypothetical protein